MSTPEKDTLHMLAIFHYVIAGLTALFACIPLMHLTMGISMTMARGGDASSWIIGGVVLIVIACLAILTGWAAAYLVFSAGKNLDRQTNYQLCTVGACVLCIFFATWDNSGNFYSYIS
ncbi:MAG: hypothetical protein K8S62_13910 [Candidatus Sabulitectum sp.]|nr:hypothetical protein [Candidatus Sabulitectum sp.]